ncbi:MAG TPA: hypothetical protein VMZ27_16415, partial [Candidatus Saccharimonadales bacterium]|nr:hypothetical protein [Candidatus Saccharimonadales bacterium]
MTVDVKSLFREELQARFQEWNEPAYRVDQVFSWIYQRRVTSWEAMSNLSKALRDKLKTQF